MSTFRVRDICDRLNHNPVQPQTGRMGSGQVPKGWGKMHTVLDLRGSIPESLYITDGRWHDSNFLDVHEPYKWAVYTMDKAYVDFEALYRMQRERDLLCHPAKGYDEFRGGRDKPQHQ